MRVASLQDVDRQLVLMEGDVIRKSESEGGNVKEERGEKQAFWRGRLELGLEPDLQSWGCSPDALTTCQDLLTGR